MSKEIISNAQKIWDYMKLNHDLNKSDLIIGVGSHDLRTADKTVEVYKQNFADKILFTGGLGKITKFSNNISEAETYRERAIELGVPEKDILLEIESTNTGENINFTKMLLKEQNIDISKAIIVDKPYKERRVFATFKKQWPELDIKVTSMGLDFKEYVNYERGRDFVIDVMVGDLNRIIEYPKLGFQIKQEVPDEIIAAYKFLVAKGYDSYLIL